MRILYELCPLCEKSNFVDYKQGDATKHTLYRESFPPVINWVRCRSCGHIFTDGYWSAAGLGMLFERISPHLEAMSDIETSRLINASIVSWVNRTASGKTGEWLDVGCGHGSLLQTAEEFGYTAAGLDLRKEHVQALNNTGIWAEVATIEEIAANAEPEFEVISFADSLEHMPFPKAALLAARGLLSDDGLLFVSCPNTDTIVWRTLGDANPYWFELEHFHNFSRKRLTALLEECGFEPPRYSVSERYRSGMELLARVRR